MRPSQKPRNIDPDRFCQVICLSHCMQDYSQENSKNSIVTFALRIKIAF